MKINSQRLLDRLDALAQIGRTEQGGAARVALSIDDTAARKTVIEWGMSRGFLARMDAIGNVFIRRPGVDPRLQPVLTGSHLDTQVNGGHLDGIFGVLSALEVLESFEDMGCETRRPIDAVIWNNEEGVRFAPVTMGSSVFAGRLPLVQVLQHLDQSGCSVQEALEASRVVLPNMDAAALGAKFHAYVEAHIEQGPVLERSRRQIGVVTGIQGVRQMLIRIRGEAAHAGTTPMASRKDAFVAAVDLYLRLCDLAVTSDPDVRFTVGRMQVLPGAPNTVPAEVLFTIDLRHPDPAMLSRKGDAMREVAHTPAAALSVDVEELIHSPPVTFDDAVVSSIESATHDLGYSHMRLMSGATHDASNTARLGPTGMIFVPSRGGISHNHLEWTAPEELVRGCEVLANTIKKLAG